MIRRTSSIRAGLGRFRLGVTAFQGPPPGRQWWANGPNDIPIGMVWVYPGFGLYSSGGAYVPYYGCDCCQGGGLEDPSVAKSLNPAPAVLNLDYDESKIFAPAGAGDDGGHWYEFTAFGQNWTLNPFADNAAGFSQTLSSYGSAATTAIGGTVHGAAGSAGNRRGSGRDSRRHRDWGSRHNSGRRVGFRGGGIGGGVSGLISAFNKSPDTPDLVMEGQAAENGLIIGVFNGVLSQLGPLAEAACAEHLATRQPQER